MNGKIIRISLSEMGLTHQSAPVVEGNLNSVLIASKEKFNPTFFNDELGQWGHRIIRAEFKDVILFGVYMPTKERKRSLFDFILNRLPEEDSKSTIFMGDFNTGKHFIDEEKGTFLLSEYMDKLEEAGLVDCWRHFHEDKREYTWYSNSGNGFRIDHAFISSNNIEAMESCSYDHSTLKERISDHSIMKLYIK